MPLDNVGIGPVAERRSANQGNREKFWFDPATGNLSLSDGEDWNDIVTAGGGGGGGVDTALETAQVTMIDSFAGWGFGQEMTGPSAINWLETMEGGEFASWDAAQNRLVALQAGRYRYTHKVNMEVNTNNNGSLLALGVDAGLDLNALPPFSSSYEIGFALPAEGVHHDFHANKTIDLEAGDAIQVGLLASVNNGVGNTTFRNVQGNSGAHTYMELAYLGPTPA